MKCFLQVIVTIALVHQVGTEEKQCSRMRSRIAHSILEKSVLKVMTQEGLDFGRECPLRPDRNMFFDNEQHKWTEVASHWNCLYCGKSFYNEKFIDLHFNNRHQNTIARGPEAVCLADHCDYLRCDVISNIKQSSFWEEALCKHKELEALRRKCQSIVKMCIPSHLTGSDEFSLQDKLESSLCSYLTCEQYWENPYEEASPQRIAAYIIASVFTVFGFIMYYTMACSHLFSDESFLADSDGLLRQRSRLQDSRRYVNYPPTEGQAIRSRALPFLKR